MCNHAISLIAPMTPIVADVAFGCGADTGVFARAAFPFGLTRPALNAIVPNR